MQYVQSSIEFNFNYGAYDQNDSLFVAAQIYEVTTGTPVFLEQVEMTNFEDGVYFGTYTGDGLKAYLIIIAVYTDGTYTSLDSNYTPSAECYQELGDNLTRFFFNYGAYDFADDLFIAANIQQVGVAPDVAQVPMDYVTLGVYFGSMVGALGDNYIVSKVVYTDGTYVTPDATRAPGTDSIQLLSPSGAAINNIMRLATLVAQGSPQVGTPDKLFITIGDSVDFQFLAVTGLGVPFDLTGATFTTFIRGPLGTVVEFDNSAHTIAVNQVTNRGQFALALTEEDTEMLAPGADREVITQVVQGESTIYFHGVNLLNILVNVPVE